MEKLKANKLRPIKLELKATVTVEGPDGPIQLGSCNPVALSPIDEDVFHEACMSMVSALRSWIVPTSVQVTAGILTGDLEKLVTGEKVATSLDYISTGTEKPSTSLSDFEEELDKSSEKLMGKETPDFNRN